MKVLIIHLSDIHIKNMLNVSSERIKHIAKSVANIEVDLQAVVVALNGDIANSGALEEYSIAKKDILTLKAELESKFGGSPVYIVGVPGNHDCDFRNEKSARRILVDSIVKNPTQDIGDDVIKQCTNVQDNYFSFLNEVQSPGRIRNVAEAYFEFEIPISGATILFKCYNTALGSMQKEKMGSLVVPHMLLANKEPEKTHDYIVSMFHHPYNWLSQNNIRTFRKHIDATSDLILTGHEHDADNYAKYTRQGESTMYLEAPAFQEHGSDEYAGFNAVWVNLGIQQQKTETFSWNATIFEPTTANTKWQPFKRSNILTTRDFLLSDSMEEELDEPGAKFVHPSKPNLTLNDIYVFPDVRVVTMDKTNLFHEEDVESKDLLKFFSNKRRLIITGKERAGKTSLSKILYRNFYEKGFVPILLKGDQVTSFELDKFATLVEQGLLAQYKNPKLPEFNQLNRDQTVIIIDDFDHIRFAPKGRQKLLDNIHKRYERVIIFSDDSIRLEEMANAKFATAILSEYAQVELKEYGYYLRSKLIEKWCRLGSEFVITEHDLECKISRYENSIDKTLQKSYLPSIPFFILIYAQSLDSTGPIGASAGSYGALCEVLITQALVSSQKAATLNTKKTYLTEIAHLLFEKNAKELTSEEFAIFHQKHCQKYNLVLDREAIFNELNDCGILARFDQYYRFKYQYYQNYFVALFLGDHLDDQKIKQQVETLCEKLHKEDNANIWLFLSHHSKNPLLVDLILNHAKSLFRDAEVPKFEEDVSFFKKISDAIPAIMLDNCSPEELRESRRRHLDANREETKDVSDDEYETSDVMRLTAQVNDAIRTMDVMGQIVKNFSGSMPKEVKFQLIDECYRLGLRVAGTVLSLWKDDPEKVVNEIVDLILNGIKDDRNQKALTKQELSDHVKSFFFFITELLSFGVLKRISHAVGAVELISDFHDVLNATSTNSFRLIDMSVKLDTLKLPTKEIVELNNKFKENILCSRLLKKLVVHHIYLFPTDYKTKQQLCESIGIPIRDMRGVDVSHKNQKRLPAPV